MKKPIMNDFDVSIYSEYPEEYYMDLAKYWEFIAMKALEDVIMLSGEDDRGYNYTVESIISEYEEES